MKNPDLQKIIKMKVKRGEKVEKGSKNDQGVMCANSPR